MTVSLLNARSIQLQFIHVTHHFPIRGYDYTPDGVLNVRPRIQES